MDSGAKIFLGVTLMWLSICLLGYLGYTYGLSIHLIFCLIPFVSGIGLFLAGVTAYEKVSKRNNKNA